MSCQLQPGNLELAISEIVEVLGHLPTHTTVGGSGFSYQDNRRST